MPVTIGYRWSILGLCTFCMMTFGVVFHSIPPILGILVDNLRLTYAQAGALMGFFTLPAVVLSLPGGMLVDRYGPRSVGIATLVTMVLGTAVVALGGSYWVMGFGRVMAGAGAIVLLVVTPQIVTSWFHDREIGLSMGIFNTAVPLGTILSLNFMGVIAHHFNWQTCIWTSLGVTVVALCLFLSLYRDRTAGEGDRPSRPHLLTVLKQAGYGIWLVGLSWGLFNVGIVSFFTYAPDYFVARGEDIAKAGLLASYPMWASIVLAPIVGILIDRIGMKWLFVAVGNGGMAMLFYLIPKFPDHASILTISIGIFVALLTPAIFSFPAELLPGPVMGFGFGMLGTAMGLGISVGPYIAGTLRDATGNYLWSFVAMAIFTSLGIIPMVLLKMREQTPHSK